MAAGGSGAKAAGTLDAPAARLRWAWQRLLYGLDAALAGRDGEDEWKQGPCGFHNSRRESHAQRRKHEAKQVALRLLPRRRGGVPLARVKRRNAPARRGEQAVPQRSVAPR